MLTGGGGGWPRLDVVGFRAIAGKRGLSHLNTRNIQRGRVLTRRVLVHTLVRTRTLLDSYQVRIRLSNIIYYSFTYTEYVTSSSASKEAPEPPLLLVRVLVTQRIRRHGAVVDGMTSPVAASCDLAQLGAL